MRSCRLSASSRLFTMFRCRSENQATLQLHPLNSEHHLEPCRASGQETIENRRPVWGNAGADSFVGAVGTSLPRIGKPRQAPFVPAARGGGKAKGGANSPAGRSSDGGIIPPLPGKFRESPTLLGTAYGHDETRNFPFVLGGKVAASVSEWTVSPQGARIASAHPPPGCSLTLAAAF